MINIYNEKSILRKKMSDLRNSMSCKAIEYNNKEIKRLFCSLKTLNEYQSFMSYVNIGKEVETTEIIKHLLKHGKKVSVPLCITETTKLLASQIFDLNELEPSSFGLMEPKESFIRPIAPKELEVILVPGLAFDRKGNRLGYGKGYYDRFFSNLSSNALKIGLAYDFQILDEVPIDHYDVPLDIIITEKTIIHF